MVEINKISLTQIFSRPDHIRRHKALYESVSHHHFLATSFRCGKHVDDIITGRKSQMSLQISPK